MNYLILDDTILLYFAWSITILSFFFCIPKSKLHLALLAFMFKQVLTWPLGLYVVDMGWIQYPIRFFENANQTSFTFEFFFSPIICAYFNIYFPEDKSPLVKLAYYALFCTALTLSELFILHHSNLIVYIHWNAYSTWLSLFITFYITRQFCLWFFQSYNKRS
ncbi:CBO0543 family protein [Sporomusa rhizae]|uniref:CBO0543 family protein n=1 Tax=Sporomusa rhizae TaxID=357999 RepID=UPI00352AC0B1